MSLYADLGLASDASDRDVKEAYHRLARQHHPDRGGDDIRFKQVSAAYNVLGDPMARARYDARPRPTLAVRVVEIPPRTLVRGGIVSLVHARPCACRCSCDLMGKTYKIRGGFRSVTMCAATCARCTSDVHVPPGARVGEIFGDNGHVRFMASAATAKGQMLRMIDGRLVAELSVPLMDALTGFTHTVDGETVRFPHSLFAGHSAQITITQDGVDYVISLRF